MLSSWFGAGVADWGDHSRQASPNRERWVVGKMPTKTVRMKVTFKIHTDRAVGIYPGTTLSNHVGLHIDAGT